MEPVQERKKSGTKETLIGKQEARSIGKGLQLAELTTTTTTTTTETNFQECRTDQVQRPQ